MTTNAAIGYGSAFAVESAAGSASHSTALSTLHSAA